MKLTYSELKEYSRQFFGAEFPWEVRLPDNTSNTDKALLVLLWNAFLGEVSTAPGIPDKLRDYL